VQDRYESTRYVAAYKGPVLVVRAGNDDVIPAEHTDRLIAAFATPPRVLELPAADHGTVAADPAYGRALARFVSGTGSPQ